MGGDFGRWAAAVFVVFAVIRVANVLLSAFLAGCGAALWFCGTPAFRLWRGVWASGHVVSSNAS